MGSMDQHDFFLQMIGDAAICPRLGMTSPGRCPLLGFQFNAQLGEAVRSVIISDQVHQLSRRFHLVARFYRRRGSFRYRHLNVLQGRSAGDKVIDMFPAGSEKCPTR
jgi:hypothetical protein